MLLLANMSFATGLQDPLTLASTQSTQLKSNDNARTVRSVRVASLLAGFLLHLCRPDCATLVVLILLHLLQ